MEKDCDEHARGKRALIFYKKQRRKESIYLKTEGQIGAWLEEGREERKREKKKGAKRGRKIKHRPQNLLKKGATIDQNRAKIDPKGSQNEAKRDKKSQQRLQGDPGPPWGGDFPATVPRPSAILGAKIEPNS